MKKFIKLLSLFDIVSACYADMSLEFEEGPKRRTMQYGPEIDIASETSDIIKEFGFYVAEKKISLKSYGKIKLTDYKLAAPMILLEAPVICVENCKFEEAVYINGAFRGCNVKIKNLIVNNGGIVENLSIGSEADLNKIKGLSVILLKGKTEVDYIEFREDIPGVVLASKDVVVKQIKNGSLLLYLTCNFCGREGELLRCSNCKQAYYCNQKCQINHWDNHKSNCK